MSGPQAYVKLAPEFGGTAFPPMEGPELRIGSSDDNHVKVHESLGVQPQHVRVVRKSTDTFYLAPVERSAAVWLYRAGQRDPVSVTGPTVITAGDSFALATPQGVRFILMLKEVDRRKRGPAAGEKAPAMTDAQKFAANMQRGLLSELWRRGRAAVLTTWFGRMIQTSWYFIKTRQFLSPVYIIGFLMMASGWGFSFRSCNANKALTASAAEEKAKAAADLESCRRGKQQADKMSMGGRMQFGDLAQAIFNQPAWNKSLVWTEMRAAMVHEIGATFEATKDPSQNASRERWFVGKNSIYGEAFNALVAADMEPDLARILAWAVVAGKEPSLAVSIDEGHEGELWDVNPTPAEAYHLCMRGLFRTTWRQANALGLKRIGEEASLSQDETININGLGWDMASQMIFAEFNKTRDYLQQPLLDAEFRDNISKETIHRMSIAAMGQCVATNTDDDRDSTALVAKQIAERLGAKARSVPAVEDPNGISGRVAMFFAMDLTYGRHKEVNVTQDALGGAFNGIKELDAEGYAMIAQRTGETLGRALAAPCALVMAGNEAKLPAAYEGKPPSSDYCAVLAARAQFKQLGE
jgi:hypothetical protein